MKIYTKAGDAGQTGQFAGPRVWKDTPRIEACGTVDELNAALGLVRCGQLALQLAEPLEQVQHDLFALGAQLATPDPAAHAMDLISDRHVRRLEDWIDELEAGLPALANFILPAGDLVSVRLHVARGICRRAERRAVTLCRAETSADLGALVVYLNRLSDLLFVMSRAANQAAGGQEQVWRSEE